MDNFVDPEKKFTSFALGKIERLSLDTKYCSGLSSARKMKQKVLIELSSVVFMNGKPFLSIFNEVILRLLSGGFFEHWMKRFCHPKGEFKLSNQIKFQTWTMSQMHIVLTVCSVPMILSLISFIFEVKMGKCLASLSLLRQKIL